MAVRPVLDEKGNIRIELSPEVEQLASSPSPPVVASPEKRTEKEQEPVKDFYLSFEKPSVPTRLEMRNVDGRMMKVRVPVPVEPAATEETVQEEEPQSSYPDFSKVGLASGLETGVTNVQSQIASTGEAFGFLESDEAKAERDRLKQFQTSLPSVSDIFSPLSDDGKGLFEGLYDSAYNLTAATGHVVGQMAPYVAGLAAAGVGAAAAGASAPVTGTAVFATSTLMNFMSNLDDQAKVADDKGVRPEFQFERALAGAAVAGAVDVATGALLSRLPVVKDLSKYVFGNIGEGAVAAAPKSALGKLGTFTGALAFGATQEGVQEASSIYGGTPNISVIDSIATPESSARIGESMFWGALFGAAAGGTAVAFGKAPTPKEKLEDPEESFTEKTEPEPKLLESNIRAEGQKEEQGGVKQEDEEGKIPEFGDKSQLYNKFYDSVKYHLWDRTKDTLTPEADAEAALMFDPVFAKTVGLDVKLDPNSDAAKVQRAKVRAAIDSVRMAKWYEAQRPGMGALYRATVESSKRNPKRVRIVDAISKLIPDFDKYGHTFSDKDLVDVYDAIKSGRYAQAKKANDQSKVEEFKNAAKKSGIQKAVVDYVSKNYRPSNPMSVYGELKNDVLAKDPELAAEFSRQVDAIAAQGQNVPESWRDKGPTEAIDPSFKKIVDVLSEPEKPKNERVLEENAPAEQALKDEVTKIVSAPLLTAQVEVPQTNTKLYPRPDEILGSTYETVVPTGGPLRKVVDELAPFWQAIGRSVIGGKNIKDVPIIGNKSIIRKIFEKDGGTREQNIKGMASINPDLNTHLVYVALTDTQIDGNLSVDNIKTLFHEFFHVADLGGLIPVDVRRMLRSKYNQANMRNYLETKGYDKGVLAQLDDVELPAWTFQEYAGDRLESGIAKLGRLDSTLPLDEKFDKYWKAGSFPKGLSVPNRSIFNRIKDAYIAIKNYLKGEKDFMSLFEQTFTNPNQSLDSIRNLNRERGVLDLNKISAARTMDALLKGRDNIIQAQVDLAGYVPDVAARNAMLAQSEIDKKKLLDSITSAKLLDDDGKGTISQNYKIFRWLTSIFTEAKYDPVAANISNLWNARAELQAAFHKSTAPLVETMMSHPKFQPLYEYLHKLRKLGVKLGKEGPVVYQDEKGVTRRIKEDVARELRFMNDVFSRPLAFNVDIAWKYSSLFADMKTETDQDLFPGLKEILERKDVPAYRAWLKDYIAAYKADKGPRLKEVGAVIKQLRNLFSAIEDYDGLIKSGRVYVPQLRHGNWAITVRSNRPEDIRKERQRMDPDLSLNDELDTEEAVLKRGGALVAMPTIEPPMNFTGSKRYRPTEKQISELMEELKKKYPESEGYTISSPFELTYNAIGSSIRRSEAAIDLVASLMSQKLFGTKAGMNSDESFDVTPGDIEDARRTIKNYVTVSGFSRHLLPSGNIEGHSIDAERDTRVFFNMASKSFANQAVSRLANDLRAYLTIKSESDTPEGRRYAGLLQDFEYGSDLGPDLAAFRQAQFLIGLGFSPATAILNLLNVVNMVPLNLGRYGIMNPLEASKITGRTMLSWLKITGADITKAVKLDKTERDYALDDNVLDVALAGYKNKDVIKESVRRNSTLIRANMADEAHTEAYARTRFWKVREKVMDYAGYLMGRAEFAARLSTYAATLEKLLSNPSLARQVIETSDLKDNPHFQGMRNFRSDLSDAEMIASYMVNQSFGSPSKVDRARSNQGISSIAFPFTSVPSQLFDTLATTALAKGGKGLPYAGYALLATMMIGGAAGLPLYQTFKKALELFVDSDTPGDIQVVEALTKMTGDKEAALYLARGLVRGLGIDAGPRIALQPFWEDMATTVMGALAGNKMGLADIAGIPGQYADAISNLSASLQRAEDPTMAAAALAPVIVRNFVKTVDYTFSDTVTNTRGTVIADANILDTGDKIAQLIGFTPEKVWNAQQRQALKNMSQQTNETVKSRIVSDIVALELEKPVGWQAEVRRLKRQYQSLDPNPKNLNNRINRLKAKRENPLEPKGLTQSQKEAFERFDRLFNDE